VVAVSPLELFGDDLIPADEAAALAGVSEATIRQWATRGRISRFPGRRRSERTLYARPEIEAIVAERDQPHLAAA
jgi:predicted site-specific integrase-resolvase